MRVTTQMVNASSRKAGLPVNNTSLLNYINGGNGSLKNSNPILERMKAKSSNQVNSAEKVKYEKLEKAAKGLRDQADKFTATGEESMFAKAKASGDYTEVYKEIASLVDKYNSTLSLLETAPGAMNEFYRKSILELAGENQEALEGIGISVDKRGKLQVDKEKLEAADKEGIEKVLGKDGKFASRLEFLAGRVEDYAESNAVSASNSYSANGSFVNAYLNRYDHKG